MLDRLDDIPWHSLHHAYGTAEDVPKLLRALLSSEDQQDDAISDLFGNISLYRISDGPSRLAIPIYRQMAAATWFAERFLTGLPWDYSGEFNVEEICGEIEPDSAVATQTLLEALGLLEQTSYLNAAVVHDLLELNFTKGNWRERTKLTNIQREILGRIVETDAAWNNAKQLWFLIPDGAKSISKLTNSDIQPVREEMRKILLRSEWSLRSWFGGK